MLKFSFVKVIKIETVVIQTCPITLDLIAFCWLYLT